MPHPLQLMCDCLVALAANTLHGATLFAKNSDRPPAERQDFVWVPSRVDKGPVRTTHIAIEPHDGPTLSCALSVPSWCWGAEHGVNEAGVAVGNETIYTTEDPRGAPDALIGMDLVRIVLERCDTADAAVGMIGEMIARHGQGGSGHDTSQGQRPRPYWSSFLVADRETAHVVETSGNTVASMRVGDTWAISNRTTIPSFDAAHRHPRQPVHLLVDPRLDASRALLAEGSVSTERLALHLASHAGGADGWTVCMHAEQDGMVVEATTASMIVELGDDPLVHWAQGSPCTTPYSTARFSELAGLLSGL